MEESSSYLNLPNKFYHKQKFEGFEAAKEIVFNHSLAKSLALGDAGFWHHKIRKGQLAPLPFAQAYAGHQFGHLTMLGDGRALILGEHARGDALNDVQLKGSGITPFSRSGDGKATTKAMLREYIMSEAMHALRIPTSRSLGVYNTDDKVYRESVEEGAVLIRIASSHIRVGTFEYAAQFGSKKDLKTLLNYTIERHYSELQSDSNKPLALIRALMRKQIDLIVSWMRVGFIHGVMNTDNVGLAGETFDYGPCSFMNSFSLDTVYSSIDKGGRYSFGNQPYITQWNMAKFAEALLPIINEDADKAIQQAQSAINEFKDIFQEKWYEMMYKKLGLVEFQKGDDQLVDKVYRFLEENKPDYINFFNGLIYSNEIFKGDWTTHAEYISLYASWISRISNHKEASIQMMKKNNPYVVPRNHKIEEALNAGREGEMEKFNAILKQLTQPYIERDLNHSFIQVPEGFDLTYQTFCGT